ncbi:MAG: hypothetical protein RIS45_1260 [Planctomycetota bacterium]|jgi:predicted outer membrane protein
MRPEQSALARIRDVIALGCAAGSDSTHVTLALPRDEAKALRSVLPTAGDELVGWHEIHAARSALERGTE